MNVYADSFMFKKIWKSNKINCFLNLVVTNLGEQVNNVYLTRTFKENDLVIKVCNTQVREFWVYIFILNFMKTGLGNLIDMKDSLSSSKERQHLTCESH